MSETPDEEPEWDIADLAEALASTAVDTPITARLIERLEPGTDVKGAVTTIVRAIAELERLIREGIQIDPES